MYKTEPFLKDDLSSEERTRREGFLKAITEAEKTYGFSFSDCPSGAGIFDVWKQEAITGEASEPTEWELIF